MGRQALRLRQLPALGPLRQLALQRQGPVQEAPAPKAAFDYVTYRVRLSRRHRERDVRHARAGDDPLAQARLRHPQPERVDQGRLLRPQRRRHLLLLEVPDQRRRLRRRRRRPRRTRPRSTRARGDVTNACDQQPLATFHTPETAGAELVPADVQRRSMRDGQPLRDQRRPTYAKAFARAASARSARRRPSRPGAPSTRAATRSSGPTRSPPPPSGARATAGSGDACTAASPTPPSTSSGSRRSACSRRTTPSSPRPIPGSASASACSAT